jgi:Chromo (CHRromatin Organisation MOdifier) domain
MSCLHSVFNVIELTTAPSNPIAGHVPKPLPPLEIVDGEEKWAVKEILNSEVINQKLWYLVKWEGFGIEHNSWESWDNVYAPDLVAEFYWRHPGAACQI